MQTTTNYGFNIVEGTDMVNPLTQLNPNFTALDTDLKDVSDATIDSATCIKTGTVHAVTRTNTDANVFRFTATGNWNTGDTMTVDGTLVSVFLTDGTAPGNGCYVINTEVIAAIQGTRVTLYVNAADASGIAFDDTNVSFTASNVQTAIEKVDAQLNTKVSLNANGVDAYSALFDALNALIDNTKINAKSVFILNDGLRDYIYQPQFLRNATDLYIFVRTSIGSDIETSQARIASSGSMLTECTGGVVTDQSSTVPSADAKFTIIY